MIEDGTIDGKCTSSLFVSLSSQSLRRDKASSFLITESNSVGISADNRLLSRLLLIVFTI